MTDKENQYISKLREENTKLKEQNKEMKFVMKEFIYRVENNEVRSTYTYNLFKKVLENQ